MGKRKCKPKMAQGGAVYPQERPVKKPPEADWKQSLAAAWDAIKGSAQPKEKPPTGNTIPETSGAIVNRQVDNLDAMKRAGYYNGGLAGVIRNGSEFSQDLAPNPLQPAGQVATTGATAIPLASTPQEIGAVPSPNELPGGTVLDRMKAAKKVALDNGMSSEAYDASLVKSPTPLGNVFSNPSAGNVLHSNAGTALTMTEKDKAMGLNPNRFYRAGAADDPHGANGLYQAASQKIASAATANALAPNQEAPQVDMPTYEKRSRMRSMADGGKIDPVEEMLKRMAEKHGTPVQQPAPRQPQQQIAKPVQQPQPQQPTGIIPTIKNRNEELKKALNYADGGMMQFKGKGGPRDDKIPVKMAGSNINVSNGEAGLILPAKTAQNPQALAQIAQTIQASNDGRAPKMGIENGGKYEGGMIGRLFDSIPEGGYLRDPEVRQAVGRAISGEGLRPDVGITGPRVVQAAQDTPQGLARAAQKAQPPVANYSNEGRPSAIQAMNTAPNQTLAKTTGNAGNAGLGDDGNLRFTQKGFDPTQQQFAQGTGAVTRNRDGKTVVVTPGNYTAADGTPTQDWYKTQAYADAIQRNEKDKAWLARLQSERQGRDPVQAIATEQGMAIAAQKAPLERQLTQQQIASGQSSLAQQAQLEQARQAIAKTPAGPERDAAIQVYQALSGKLDNRPIAVDMGETISPDGMMKSKNPNVLYDPNTRQTIALNGGQQAKTFTKDEVAAALKNGADKAAVAARIKSLGGNPKDYGL